MQNYSLIQLIETNHPLLPIDSTFMVVFSHKVLRKITDTKFKESTFLKLAPISNNNVILEKSFGIHCGDLSDEISLNKLVIVGKVKPTFDIEGAKLE